MNRGQYLRNKIQEQGTLKWFSQKIDMPYSTLLSILKNVGGASIDNIVKICKGLNISADDLERLAESTSYIPDTDESVDFEVSDDPSSISKSAADYGIPETAFVPLSKKKIPLLGTIAAGQPIYADQYIEEYLPVDLNLNADFGLHIRGDSMINANINDGDIVFIRSQPDVDDGQIAAVLIDDDATLKRVYHMPDGIQLIAENPAYRPIICNAATRAVCRILGLAVAVLGRVK